MDGKEKGKLKRMRRARGGRTLPRSGGGVHEDKKSKKLERQLEEELEDNADVTDEEFWEEWKYPDLYDDDWDEE
jgi:hypothetical protein